MLMFGASRACYVVLLQGMFSFTGLNPDQTKKLVEEHSVYLTGKSGSSVQGRPTRADC